MKLLPTVINMNCYARGSDSFRTLSLHVMAPLVDGWDYGSWSAVYNALSFGIAGMGSATIFFWLQVPNVTKRYRTALTITGLVTFIATYHYFRIFNSWNDAFDVNRAAVLR